MDVNNKLIVLANEEVQNPHAYLKSIPDSDTRWDRINQFWQLPSGEKHWISNIRLRKQRSKQVLVAILNGRYCKSNIEIIVDHQERVITFCYRGTIIG